MSVIEIFQLFMGGGGGEGEGEAEERKVDFAAQCQDPKSNNTVFLLS